MTASSDANATPAGGPSTIGGVIYQMLWCLLRLTRYEIRRIDVAADSAIGSAVLVLEPHGGGGDVREVSGSKYIVTQLKARSRGGTWSLQEVITTVLPDLLKAVKPNAPDPIYQFVTDGRRGEWAQVERFFRSLRYRDYSEDPSDALDDTNRLQVGRHSRSTFWTKTAYTERELFAKVVDVMVRASAGSEREELERTVWHLLGRFEFAPPLSQAAAENEIDLALSELIERSEDIPVQRRALLMRLSELARQGNVAIDLNSFLNTHGLKAIPRNHVAALQLRSRAIAMQRLRECEFDESQHVQESFTEALVAAVHDVPVVVLVGDSGAGKSWHSYALTEALSRQGALVAHVDATGDARRTLDIAVGVLWNTVKGQDGTLPYDRAAMGLPGPPPSRVLIVDRVDDPVLASDLVRARLEELGLRLVVAASAQAAESFPSLGSARCRAIPVPSFTQTELGDYLLARRVPRSGSIPADVRELLAQPMLARIYCDLQAGATWNPKNEYELFRKYWTTRLERNPRVIPTLDLSLLRDLARALLDGEAYPWRAGFVNETLKHEGSLARLQRSGWFEVHQSGACSLWHDRLLNWLIADTLVEDFLSGRRTVADLSTLVKSSYAGELTTGGRRLGYVAMDTLWLLSERNAPPAVFASVLAALESARHSHSLYTEMVPTLGERAGAGVLARLEQHLVGELADGAIETATCLSRISSSEAIAKARALLLSESPQQHTVALHILRRQGDPVSLDRLWALHLRAESTPNRLLEYERRMHALEAGIKLRSEWLKRKLELAAGDTPGLVELIYLLSKVTDNGKAWRDLKAHLKVIVPEDKRRCLVQCIKVFDDTSEIEFIQVAMRCDTDMVGDAALAALTRLAPDTAIQELAQSELRYLSLTRGWHLHRLLAARPDATRAAVRRLVTPAPRRAQDLYSSAENEIDSASFDDVLDGLTSAVAHALTEEVVDPNSGALSGALDFVQRVCRSDLLETLRARRGTRLEGTLAEYLLAIGPRSHLSARRCDRSAFAILESIKSEELARIVEAGLDAGSWYGRIDAAEDAHKHADEAVRLKLRSMAAKRAGDDHDRLVAYVAAHALCFLEDWDSLLPIVMQSGLEISPYLFDQRAGQPRLIGPHVENIRSRLVTGELTSGLLLAAGLSREPTFIPPLVAAFTSGTLGRDESLSAAIALNTLDASEPSVVTAMVSHLEDVTLRDRFLEFLLDMDTPGSLAAVAEALLYRFDPEICAFLARHDGFALRAAELAWQNRTAAERSLSYAVVVPLFGLIDAPETRAYLENLAFGVGRSMLGHALRVPGIRGLSTLDQAKAFAASESSLHDRLCEERDAMPSILMELDAERAARLLLEVAPTADDETVEFAIADALATADVESELVTMFDSEAPVERRVACVLAGRRPDPEPFRELLRARALDIDESVASTAIRALREQIRVQAVAALVQSAIHATDKRWRWVLLDQVARHARGRREVPPVLHSTLTSLAGELTPLEARRFNERMEKGREEYGRAAKERAQRKARGT